ncbi:MAG: hypothetical protein KDK08_29525, partial [Rhizobiaceae bacterium]|nr:hypothetical protein [Rhizobiaceae bacterium]
QYRGATSRRDLLRFDLETELATARTDLGGMPAPEALEVLIPIGKDQQRQPGGGLPKAQEINGSWPVGHWQVPDGFQGSFRVLSRNYSGP